MVRKFILWLKGLGWLSILAAALGGAVFAARGAKAVAKRNSAKRKEDQAELLINSQISKHIAAGKALKESAHEDRTKAVEVEDRMMEKLDELGTKNESIADIADRFNKRRMRNSV